MRGRSENTSATEPVRAAQRRSHSTVREYAESLIVAILLALAIRTFVVQAFVIPSGSMLPTLQIGDYLLVNKLAYMFRPIRRGDIIVFKFPRDESQDFIKRVVGLPGETVEIRGRRVLINGRELTEPYAVYREPPAFRPPEGTQVSRTVIPSGHLFVMGDNRDNSLDSRAWGLLKQDKVLGRAAVVYFSLRSEAIPQDTPLPGFLYALVHPSLERWGRIGHLVQ
jgi:signal peptidase I